MKKLLLFLSLFYFLGIHAQQTKPLPKLFEVKVTPSGKSILSSKGSKMKDMLENRLNKEIRKVKFQDLNKMAKDGTMDKDSPAHFEITIPKGKGTRELRNILAVPTHIDMKENGDYEYFAELVNGKNTKGYLTLIHEGNQNFGSMTIEGRDFNIVSDDVEGDLLVELDEMEIKQKSCGTDMLVAKNPKKYGKSLLPSEAMAARAGSAAACEVRVLVLFTPAADRVSNPAQLAPALIANMNNSLRNTTINSGQLNFRLAGTRAFNFIERPAQQLLELDRLVGNAVLDGLRADLGADLVVVLTDGNYSLYNGIATLDDYSDADAGYVAIVEADAPGLVLAHEVGHLMGNRHDTDTRTPTGTGINRLPPNLSTTAKGHQWYIRNCFFCQKLYRKSVNADGGTDGLVTPFYSNPAVKSESAARGNTGTNERNNFRQLLAAAPIVAAYNGFVELAVGISGPSTVNVGQQYTLTANVQNCPGTTYRWERSENGVNYFTVGTARTTTSTAIPVSGNRVYYRLRVTCTDGQTRTVTWSVFIQGGPGGPILLQARIQTDSLADYTEELSEAFVLYPNPAQDQVSLITDFQGKEQVTVMIYGITPMGYEKRLFKGRLENGQGQLILDVSNVPQGLYQLVVIADGAEFVGKRLLISRQ